MIEKCQICDALMIENTKDENYNFIECFHAKDCPLNWLSNEDWEKEKKRRTDRLVDCILKEMKCDQDAEKMSYTELGDFLINEFWSREKFGTMNCSVISRVIAILQGEEKDG